MADIDVERKGPSIWPWIIGLLVLALLIWALMEMFGSDEPETVGMMEDTIGAPLATPGPPADVGAAMPAAVQTYLTECTEQTGATGGDMGTEHEYTVNCLRQLREGMNALITGQQADANVSARFDEYTSSVQQLEATDPASTDHANLTRIAANTATEAMQQMSNAWYTAQGGVSTAVSEAQQAAQGIQETVPMLEQRESVRTFFREAGDALREMAGAQPAGGTTAM